MITFLVVEAGSDPVNFRLDDSALFRGHSRQGRGLYQAQGSQKDEKEVREPPLGI